MRLPTFLKRALPAVALMTAVIATYVHSLGAPYLLDDIAAIERNDSTRDLGNLRAVLQPPSDRGITVGGRPVLNLSFALNRAWLGHRPEAYRGVNVAIHAGCVLLAFGLLRRLGERLGKRVAGFADSAGSPFPRDPALQGTAFPFAIALAWAVHPLNTSAVTYLSQRAESLAGLFYLLTVYAFVRTKAAERSPPATLVARGLRSPVAWSAVSVLACFLGVATKEIVVTAPVVILLLDRWCFAGSFGAAWRARRGMYLGLGASWILAAWLIAGAASRGGTVGFATPISPVAYLGTQVYAITHYLQLAAWPTPLVFDYGSLVVPWREVLVPGLALLGLGALVVVLGRNHRGTEFPGYLAALTFLLLLAPTSSLVPIASQTVAEHRMYLPGLVLLAGCGFGLAAMAGVRSALAGLMLIAGGWAVLTWQRNLVLQDEVALWRHTSEQQPGNARARSNLAVALARDQDLNAAVDALDGAIALQPDFAEARNNLGFLLVRLGRPLEALPHLEHAVRLRPNDVDILGTYGAALFLAGRTEAAAETYQRALLLAPTDPELQFGLANTELQRGRATQAIALYERALQRDPARTDARYNLGLARLKAGQNAAALAEFEAVLRLAPDHAAARLELANILQHLGRLDEAAGHYRVLLMQDPQSTPARAGLQRIEAQTRHPRP